MLVTVATLYDDDKATHYVQVIHGKVSEKDRHTLAEQFDATYASAELEEGRSLYFAEMETCDSIRDVTEFETVYGKE